MSLFAQFSLSRRILGSRNLCVLSHRNITLPTFPKANRLVVNAFGAYVGDIEPSAVINTMEYKSKMVPLPNNSLKPLNVDRIVAYGEDAIAIPSLKDCSPTHSISGWSLAYNPHLMFYHQLREKLLPTYEGYWLVVFADAKKKEYEAILCPTEQEVIEAVKESTNKFTFGGLCYCLGREIKTKTYRKSKLLSTARPNNKKFEVNKNVDRQKGIISSYQNMFFTGFEFSFDANTWYKSSDVGLIDTGCSEMSANNEITLQYLQLCATNGIKTINKLQESSLADGRTIEGISFELYVKLDVSNLVINVDCGPSSVPCIQSCCLCNGTYEPTTNAANPNINDFTDVNYLIGFYQQCADAEPLIGMSILEKFSSIEISNNIMKFK